MIEQRTYLCALFAILSGFLTVDAFLLDGNGNTSMTTLQGGGPKCVDTGDIDCESADTLFQICTKHIDNAKSVCPQYCDLCGMVNGQWACWSQWSSCSVTCGNGHKVRTRTCTEPVPAHHGLDCVGSGTENTTCIPASCPVHGGWSTWGSWGSCSASCGVGTTRRERSCSNPPPQYFGDHCFGENDETRLCFPKNCTVHGGWSAWNHWGSCSASCGVGTQRRDRSCTNPHPQYFGDHCPGDSFNVQICVTGLCPTGAGWSAWTSWGPCSKTCGIGIKTRTRDCNNPPPSLGIGYCSGPTSQTDICGIPELCPHEVHTSTSCCVEYPIENPSSSADFITKVRLCDGNGVKECHPHRGRLEIYHSGNWGTVCDDHWDLNRNAVNVLCRSIGFAGGENVATQPGSSSPIILDNVVCNGHETHIDFCSHAPFGSDNCDHDEDITIQCTL